MPKINTLTLLRLREAANYAGGAERTLNEALKQASKHELTPAEKKALRTQRNKATRMANDLEKKVKAHEAKLDAWANEILPQEKNHD